MEQSVQWRFTKLPVKRVFITGSTAGKSDQTFKKVDYRLTVSTTYDFVLKLTITHA